MYYAGVIKIAIMAIAFYFIKQLDIPDSYKFLLTVIPSLLLLSTNYVIRNIQHAGKNKPITVKLKDDASDKPLLDEFYFEEPFTIEIQQNANAVLHEYDAPYWIKAGGYLDISNQNNFVKLDNIHLANNYTLEFWLRLKSIANNGIVSFNSIDGPLFSVNYDDKFIYINQTTKIPYTVDQWFHFTIMRGKSDMLGTSKGLVYINGIFYSYINNLPNLQDMSTAFLFKNSNAPMDYNKNYHDLCNCALVRFYDRSLTIDELQNNYLMDAYYFGIQEENKGINRTYVGGSGLIFYLECRVPTDSINDKSFDIEDIPTAVVEKPIEVMYNISRQSSKTKKPRKVELLKPETPKEIGDDEEIILVGFASDRKPDDWLNSAEKYKEPRHKVSSKTISIPEETEEALQNNWLDGKPKKLQPKDDKDKKQDNDQDSDETKETSKQEGKVDKKKTNVKVNKVNKKDTNKINNKGEVKTSKPIF
jgi:hypothetical protein